MKHASSREMYRYWTTLRGRRAAPEREEIEPAALRRVLGDSFILSVRPACGHEIRLAGTRVCALFCRELKAASFLQLWEHESRALIDSLIDIVTAELTAVVAGIHGRSNGESLVPLELLLLPLAPDAMRHARLIGVLAPLEPAYWIGISAVQKLTLRTFRHIEPAAAETVSSRPPPPAHPGNPARRQISRLNAPSLVVYEGGATTESASANLSLSDR
ncbi:MAG: PAS domain-containing protein [Xanthobacteraceae bacterium]